MVWLAKLIGPGMYQSQEMSQKNRRVSAVCCGPEGDANPLGSTISPLYISPRYKRKLRRTMELNWPVDSSHQNGP